VIAPGREAAVIEGADSLPPAVFRDWELPIWDVVGGKTPPAPPVAVQVRLRPGDRLAWQHATDVVGAPGHTPGSIALRFERERVLVAGDAIAMVAGRPVSGVFNVDPALADEPFAALAALDPEIACLGHGEPIRGAAGARLRAAIAA
jgi:glyoxylase-like metal-dependent hydrolase (beta-lactamase superfamily II)